AAVAPRRAALRLGTVAAPGRLREPPSARELAALAEASFPPEALRATRAVDRLLGEFARGTGRAYALQHHPGSR
ncbi:MAG: hypothetical protein KGM24_04890, partial [Elusimicrobia bacterium]|nr:hypothetical protein [Elusimicrobiota bacterium]